MAKFFGSLILALYDLLGCMSGALCIFAAFIAFILTPFVKTFVFDGKKAEQIQADLDKADSLLKKNKDAYANQVSKLFQKYNILVFLPSLNFLARLLFGLILIWGFSSPDVKALGANLFGAEFALSCKVLFAAPMTRRVVFIVAGFAIVQEYYFDRIVTEKLPYDQRIPDAISIAILIALVLFLPMAFSFYWFFITLFDHLLYKYYSKNKKQQEKIQQELEDVIAGRLSKKKNKDKDNNKKRKIKRL